jgi:polyhydroxyalkanoate synthase subunit PhaC
MGRMTQEPGLRGSDPANRQASGSPGSRRGPRPLPLHLGLAALRGWTALASPMPPGLDLAPTLPPILAGSPPGWPSWKGGWPRSTPGQREAARIAAGLAAGGHRPEAFRAAVLRALLRQDAALLAGILAYRRHPWRRDLPEPPTLWAEGGSRLLDYGAGGGAGRGGMTLLFVPSLINRATVLDLLPEASMLRFLAAQPGLRPLLLDWGTPAGAERGFTLTDYIAGRLERALAVAATRGPVVLVGYCMGGLLSLAAALRRPDHVRALALLATPWDFWAEGETRPRALAGLLPGLEPLLEASGILPVDAIQMLFAGLDPFAIAAKFRAFARLDPEAPLARRFVALEDWLNDGVPLAAPVAREGLAGWYGANTPARGLWRVAGEVVDPARLDRPAFLAVPSRDRIVPPASATALAGRLRCATLHPTSAGHIGMVAGGGAEAALWRPFLAWVRALEAGTLVGQGATGPDCTAAKEGGRTQS